jgi:hypothetical protein
MPREMPESATIVNAASSMSPKNSSNSNSNKNKQLDLGVIDEAFGDFADLYSDVLRVSVAASPDQIQMAYFDRRSELFTMLAKMDSRPSPQDEGTVQERMAAERKMDSVVLAVRILGDADQRLVYDHMRQQRLLNRRRAEHGQLPGHKARVGAGLDAQTDLDTDLDVEEDVEEEPAATGTQPKEKKSPRSRGGLFRKRKKKNREDPAEESAPSPPRGSSGKQVSSPSGVADLDLEQDMTDDEDIRGVETRDMDEFRQDDGDTTVYSMASVEKTPSKSGYLSCITNSRIMRKLSDEISGACEDTLVSVDQVFNAFTLTDKDIKAVTKRIDKAKRQLDG